MARIRSIGVLVAFSLALACGEQGSDESPGREELVLRSYSAPGRAQSLDQAISRLLVLGERRVGSVDVGPDDQLLVLAPSSVHEGVAALIEAQSGPEGATSPTSVVMTYWFVAGRSVTDGDERAVGLDEIGAALDEIDGVQGSHEYRLIERLELRQAEGFRSEARSRRVRILQKVVSASSGSVVAEMTILVDEGTQYLTSVSTLVNLRAGQFLVLGQLALHANVDPFGPPRVGRVREEALAARARPAETALYTIVRAETDPRS